MLTNRKFPKQFKTRTKAAPMKSMPLPTGTGEEIGEPKSSVRANAAEEAAEYNDGDTGPDPRAKMADDAVEHGAREFTKIVNDRAKKHARKKC